MAVTVTVNVNVNVKQWPSIGLVQQWMAPSIPDVHVQGDHMPIVRAFCCDDP